MEKVASGDGGKVLGFFFQPIATHNPFDETLAQLVRAIRVGAVSVGDKFPGEYELSERLGVSRNTIREAIRALEHAGYVTTARGRYGGTVVLRNEPQGLPDDRGPKLLETLDLRLAIEPGAAALAARCKGSGLVDGMRTLVAEMESTEEPDLVSRTIHLNGHLHMLFGQASGNETLERSVTAIELRMMEAALSMPRLNQSKDSHRQHRAVIDAIEAGEPSAAREEMEDHLVGSETALRELAIPMKSQNREMGRPEN